LRRGRAQGNPEAPALRVEGDRLFCDEEVPKRGEILVEVRPADAAPILWKALPHSGC